MPAAASTLRAAPAPEQAHLPRLPPSLPCPQWESFDELKARVEREWAALPPTADVLSPSLKQKRVAVAERLGVQGQFTG